MPENLDLDGDGGCNMTKHKAKVVTEWLNEAKINVLEWSLQSVELNPIENLWRELKGRVNARHPKNINELETICKKDWSRIPSDICLNVKLQQVFHAVNYF